MNNSDEGEVNQPRSGGHYPTPFDIRWRCSHGKEPAGASVQTRRSRHRVRQGRSVASVARELGIDFLYPGVIRERRVCRQRTAGYFVP